MIEKITEIYNKVQNRIIKRLKEFGQLWVTSNDYDIFVELAFCLLTPQSKAVSCWECVKILKEKDLLLNGKVDQLQKIIKKYARFHNTKAKRIVEARTKFCKNGKIEIKSYLNTYKSVFDKRSYLVKNIKGYGYKEASHFLRNIGFGEDIAILDRHIYKNLKLLNLIKEVPKAVSSTKYLEIEKMMSKFAKKINIPMSHLDFVLWYKEAGEIFK